MGNVADGSAATTCTVLNCAIKSTAIHTMALSLRYSDGVLIVHLLKSFVRDRITRLDPPQK
jgi:hypothetical protein